MTCLLKLISICLIVVVLLSTICVRANECVKCPSASANEFVCGVDGKGVIRRFGSECLLRFENCDKKTTFEIVYNILCD